MKKIFLPIIAIAFILFTGSSIAQTADEIINKHLEARGGADKLRALQSMIMEGSMNQGGTDVEMKFYYQQNKAIKVEFTAAGQSGYNIVTSTEGWVLNPFMGHSSPVALTAEELKDAQSQLDMQGPLLDYKAKGHTVEYLGKESVQGEEFYKLRLTRASGKIVTYYMNKDYLVTKSVTTALVQGSEQEVTQEYADYRKTPEGYVIAFKRSNGSQEFYFSKIEINPKIDEAVFKPSN